MAATFHDGELALQRQAGALQRLAQAGPKVIRNHMPEQHREFFAQLPFLVAGSVDAQGQPWASVLAGPPGFVASPDPRQLVVAAKPLPHDPLAATLAPGVAIGLLGIQPHTRRRNRLNGHILQVDGAGFSVRVDQSFGNCPKYIQAREGRFIFAASALCAAEPLDLLDQHALDMVQRADTFFIATAHPFAGRDPLPAYGVDVSHRGGKPGFVRTDSPSQLTVPDFLGNFFFNTLGNLALNPRCGLLFMDFGNGDLLHIAGRCEIVSEDAKVRVFAGAQRLLRLHLVSALRMRAALPLRWSQAELSPLLAATGAWA